MPAAPKRRVYTTAFAATAPPCSAAMVCSEKTDPNLKSGCTIDRRPARAYTCRQVGQPRPLPESLPITLADQVYVEKEHLPQPMRTRLGRLAAFQNPECYRAQAMRFAVWDKPRVIG